MLTITDAIAQCVTPAFQPEMRALVSVESSGNPHAIALIGGGTMLQQPQSEEQARKTARLLESLGMRYAAGAAQINRANFKKLGLSEGNAFNACASVSAGETVLRDCLVRAVGAFGSNRHAREAAWSCYYSGNFNEGFEKKGHRYSYVERMRRAIGLPAPPTNYAPTLVSRGAPRPVAQLEREDANALDQAGQSSNVFGR